MNGSVRFTWATSFTCNAPRLSPSGEPKTPIIRPLNTHYREPVSNFRAKVLPLTKSGR